MFDNSKKNLIIFNKKTIMMKIKLLTMIFIASISSSCKNTDFINVENKDTQISLHHDGITTINYHSVLQKNAEYYNNNSIENILDDLVKNRIISNIAKNKILKNIHNKSQQDFKEEVLQRIKERSSSFPTYSTSSEETNHPEEGLLDDELAVEVFDNMTLMLLSRGISWGCAGAIAGVGLSIAGGIVGGPVTIAAAAIWGAGHIVSVLSLTACVGSQASEKLEEDILNNTEEEFIVLFTGEYVEKL